MASSSVLTRSGSKALVAVVAGAAVPAIAAAPAGADSWGPHTSSTTGAQATCTVTSWDGAVHDDHARISCSITDTSRDGDSVYVGWKQDGYATISLYNSAGAPKTVSRTDARVNHDGSFGTLRWRICRDRQAPFSDSCSGWREYKPVK